MKARAIPSCSTYLETKHTNVAGIPPKLATYASVPAEASSVCSCLLQAATATTSTPTSLATCPATCKATTTLTITSASTTTVTVTQTGSPSTGSVDENGCPAVDGNNVQGYIIHCASTADSGGFLAGTNPGYNIEDCASQCNDNPDNIDCLAATYTPPGSPFSIIDGHLTPGTCGFYEFVDSAVPAPGSALAVFENTFVRRKRT